MSKTVKARHTEFELWYNGVNISADIAGDVESFTYTDSASDVCDSIDLTISARDEKWRNGWWPQKGDKLHPKIIGHIWNVEGYRYEIDCGTFTLDEMQYADSPQTITMRAVAVPSTSDFNAKERGDVWKNTTLRRIAETIAGRYGMGFGYDCNGFDYDIEKREQNGTDSSFLQELCSDYGLVLKVYADRLWVYDREFYKSKRAVQDVPRDEMKQGTFTWTTDLMGTYTAGEFSYTDADKDADITASVGSGSRTLSVSQYASSVADAAAQLAAALNNENHKTTQMSFTVVGNFHMYSGANVRILDFGPNMDGKYFIDRATHKLDRNGGFTTQIETVGIRDAFHAWQVGGSIVYNEKQETAMPDYSSTYASASASAAAGGSGGQAVQLNNCPLYYTSVAKSPSNYVSGTYYLYDGILVAGRYRITNTPSRCGKQPVGKNVTGWVNASDIG